MRTRLLLVEDTDDLRRLFARMLRGHGYEVREAEDGQAALECLSAFAPEVVVTDLMMPVLDGYELIRRIRSMPAYSGVPVVAMTASCARDAREEALRAGAVGFVKKPVDASGLLELIASARSRA